MSSMYWYERVDTMPKHGRLWQMMKTASNIPDYCLGIEGGEQVLVVTDTEVSPLVSDVVAGALTSAGAECAVAVMNPLPHPNAEPPAAVAAAMKACDVTVAVVSRTITHTKAREEATQEYKRRYLLTPNVSEDMFIRGACTADWPLVEDISMTTAKRLSSGRNIRLTCENGSDLSVDVDGRPFRAYFGKCRKDGDVQVFPGGEANTLPIPESINGRVVFDSFMMEVGLLDNPITIEFREGRAVEISGGREAERLREVLESTGSEDSYRFGEFSVGTNYRARTLGNSFEDKQVYGTVHIAVGSGVSWPKYYKPDYHAPIHLDGVMSRPHIEVDGEVVVTGGNILVAPKPGQ